MAEPLLPTERSSDDAPDAPTFRERTPEQQEVISCFQGYLREAEDMRRSGENPRDEVWDDNIDRYWMRQDFSQRADWQSQEVLPEFSSFVDRFAAALKEAWMAAGVEGTYNIVDPSDSERDLSRAVKRMNDVWLSTCGSSAQGHPLPFETVIEDQAKMGALMACCATVLWQDGRTKVETVDPRKVWLDATGRGLYRVRKVEMDRDRLEEFSKVKGKGGKPLYNLDEIGRLTNSWLNDERTQRASITGHGKEITSARMPLCLHEFYGTILTPEGKVLGRNALTIMADETHIIRGPEPNPFWHERDWLVFSPLVSVPLSVYGKTYGEDFGHIGDTFTKLTNLILDAVAVTSMKVFAVVPEMLKNAGQLASGVHPGKIFELQDGYTPQDFMHAIDMGTLSGDTVQVWQMLKSEMTEAAGVNEIGLGQFAPNSRTSATEVSETTRSSSALVRSVAQTFEQRFIEPVLNLNWKTGIQHVRAGDKVLAAAAGEDLFSALLKNRKKLAQRPITFQARGISNLIQKGQKLRALLQLLQVVAGNPILMQEFMKVVSMPRLVDLLMDLSNLDPTRFTMTEREKMVLQLTQAMPQAMPGMGSEQGTAAAGGLARAAGIAQQ